MEISGALKSDPRAIDYLTEVAAFLALAAAMSTKLTPSELAKATALAKEMAKELI